MLQNEPSDFPTLQNFACEVILTTENTVLFDPSKYPPFSESNWADYSNTVMNPGLSEALIGIALQKLNATRHIGNTWCDSVPYNYPSLFLEGFIIGVFRHQIVISSFPGYSFFSCYWEPRGVSFSLYLAPYDTTVWIVMLITILLSAFLVSLGFYLHHKKCYPFTIFLYFFGCLVEDVGALPDKLRIFFPFKLISVPWLFISALLSSFYLGIFITNLNSRLPGERVDTYEKISCQGKPQNGVNFSMIIARFASRGNYTGEGTKTFSIPRITVHFHSFNGQ